jgi:hypothetical protein
VVFLLEFSSRRITRGWKNQNIYKGLLSLFIFLETTLSLSFDLGKSPPYVLVYDFTS